MGFNPFDFVGDLFKGAVNIVTGVFKAVGKVVNAVLDFVLQPFLGNMDTPNVNESARQQGVLVQQEGSNVNIPVVYGFRKVGGIVTFAETGSTDNKYLYVAYVFSEGLVEGLYEIYIDDNLLPGIGVQELNSGLTHDVNSEKYSGRVQMQWFPGYYYTDPTTSPVGASIGSGVFNGSPSWKTSMVYNGLATLFVRYEWKKIETQADADNNPFSGSIPKIQVSLLGKRVKQLATKSYNANNILNVDKTGVMTSNSSTYWSTSPSYDQNGGKYSTNPVEILHDYLRNPRYGKGMALTEMDQTTWINAANKCNQNVTYYTGAIGPILTTNYVLDTSQTLFNNTKALLSGFRAYMPYVNGKYKLKIEDAGNETDITSGVATIVQTITKNEIVGDVVYTGIERTAKYNQVTVTWVDPDQKWSNQQAVWPTTETERQTYIQQDGGRENKSDITMGTITNPIMALDMARIIFNKSRYQESCSLKISAQGFELEPGDNIYIKSNLLNFGLIPWRIISIKLNNDYTFDLACVRNPDTIYPYVRYGEPDIVRETYIPKGNDIYFPPQIISLKGVFPPNYAGVVLGTSTYPGGFVAPSNPTDAGNPGGGIGSPTGPSNTTPVNNTPPNPATPVVTNDHIIQFVSVNYYSGNIATISFKRPDIATYDGVKFYYRQNGTNFFIESPVLNNTATTFTLPVSPDKNISYFIIARVKYANGDFSSNVNKVNITAYSGLNGASPSAYFDFQNIQTQDTGFVNLDASPQVTSIVATPTTTPYSLTIKVKEDSAAAAVTGRPGSLNIQTILVYYRPLTQTSFLLYEYNMPALYGAYEEMTIPMASLFGTNSATQWEIVVQYRFANGKLGNLQYRQSNISIVPTTVTAVKYNATVKATTLELAATSSSTANISYANVTFIQGVNNGLNNTMRVYFRDPSLSSANGGCNLTGFAGARVELAKITPGSAITYSTKIEKTNTQLTKDSFSTNPNDYWIDVALGTSSAEQYNVIITLSYYSGTTPTYSTYAVKYSGYFDPANRISQIATVNGLNLVNGMASLYSIQKQDAEQVVPNLVSTADVLVPTDVQFIMDPSWGKTTTSPYPLPHFKILFNIPTGITFTKIRVYRRTRGNTKFEYTDMTTSGDTCRFGVISYTQLLIGTSATVSGQLSDHELYIQLWKGGVASRSLLKIPLDLTYGINDSQGVALSILPKDFSATANIKNLDVDTALNSAVLISQTAISTQVYFLDNSFTVVNRSIK